MIRKLIIPPLTLSLILAFAASSVSGSVFQYAITVQTDGGEREALLWLPPESEQIRGVVVAGMTLMEAHFVQDEQIRKACADQDLALLFLRPGLSSPDIQQVLDDAAAVSGYEELGIAPVMFVGQSANGPPARARAVEFADRCFGLIQYRGGGPWGDPDLPAGVPALMMVGQFDEFAGTMRNEEGREAWEGPRDEMIRYRRGDTDRLATFIVEPGAGHFAWSERNAEYTSAFIRKAAAARIPETWPTDADEPVTLKAIDPATGWLSNLTINESGPEPAMWDEYDGDRERTNWHFDREMAEKTIAYHEGLNREDQFIRWEDRHWVDAGARFFFIGINWVDDGQTFKVNPVYRETYPGQFNGHGPRWHKAGEPVGHSDAPIRVKPVGGALVATGDDTLRIEYNAVFPATGRSRFTFMAYSKGDERYRYTEQVGMLPRGFSGLDRGSSQTITFPELDDVPADSGPVKLEATSDADLPVAYHLAYGPAEISDGELRLAQVPRRATFPIEVKVVAYQFGSGVDPQVRTANPVERTFLITGP